MFQLHAMPKVRQGLMFEKQRNLYQKCLRYASFYLSKFEILYHQFVEGKASCSDLICCKGKRRSFKIYFFCFDFGLSKTTIFSYKILMSFRNVKPVNQLMALNSLHFLQLVLCKRYSSNFFTYINSLNSHNTSLKYVRLASSFYS